MSTNTGRCPRLLVIDDNPAIHEDFRKILIPPEKSAGPLDDLAADFLGETVAPNPSKSGAFEVDSAYQGQEGLSLVERAQSEGMPYSMAFVDMRMPPGLNGVETTSRIWKIDPDLQVVICTAYSDCSWDEMLNTLGRSDRLVILKKPFDPIEVLQLANSLTRKRQLLQESNTKMTSLENTVVIRTEQIEHEQEKFRTIFENSPEGIFQITGEGRILAANPALAAIFGYATPAELMEKLTDMHALYVEHSRLAEFRGRLEREKIVRGFESEINCRDGSRKWISETACTVTKLDGSLLHYQGFVVDITAQKSAQRDRDLIEVQLRQAQKLESVGQLAAGIAHEINTPIQYVSDNIRFIEETFTALGGMLQECQKFALAVESSTVTPEILSAVEASIRTAEIDYLRKEIPLAVQQSLHGVSQVSRIVKAMKEFSHPGSRDRETVDLNHAIDMTITVARGEWKYVADVQTDFAKDLPSVRCLPGEINQVILNLITNAAHAIGDVCKEKEDSKGVIRISTRGEGGWVEIRVSDTGTGIPEEIRHRVYDPFFTTKEVGKGTGQGLAIAHSVIVDKHGGQLSFESTVGRGTTFIIRLPIG